MAYFTHEIAVKFDKWKKFYEKGDIVAFEATKTLQLESKPPSGWEPIVFLEVAGEAQFDIRNTSYEYVSSTQLAISIRIIKQYDIYPGEVRLRARLGFNPTGSYNGTPHYSFFQTFMLME